MEMLGIFAAGDHTVALIDLVDSCGQNACTARRPYACSTALVGAHVVRPRPAVRGVRIDRRFGDRARYAEVPGLGRQRDDLRARKRHDRTARRLHDARLHVVRVLICIVGGAHVGDVGAGQRIAVVSS